MNRKRQEVELLWLSTRATCQRTGSEAQSYADECWERGLRLSVNRQAHYDLVMMCVRWTLTD